jgi:hypothetical protein
MKDHDIFLSHSHADTAAVKKLAARWEGWKYSVYADFKDKALLDASRNNIMTAELANRLFDKIQRCVVFVFVASKNSASSGWMPWELGLAHGAVGRVHLYMLQTGARTAFSRREYLDLYKDSTFDAKTAEPYLARVVREASREPVNPAQWRAAHRQGEVGVEAFLEGRPLDAYRQLTQSPVEQGLGTVGGMAGKISDVSQPFSTSIGRRKRS